MKKVKTTPLQNSCEGVSYFMLKFTDKQIDTLREQFESIDRIDPCSKTYRQLKGYLGSLPMPLREQLVKAKIKWVAVILRGCAAYGKPNWKTEA